MENVKQRTALLSHPALRNKWVQATGWALLVLAVYAATSPLTTPYDHYVRLADAFFHGRGYLLDAPAFLELARYGEKAFVINPPAPTLFVMPWVAIWGLNANQAVISILVAAGAIGLFWIAITQLGWDLRFRIGMTALLAFGTSFWWSATTGSVWLLAHVSAVFFLMAALAETTSRNRPWLTAILVGLAGLSRLPVFLSAPFFVYMLARGQDDWRAILKRLTLFALVLGFLGALYLLYTYAEYGTLPSDTNGGNS